MTGPPIPYPYTGPTACRPSPNLFSHERTTEPAARRDIEQARRLCSRCPIATDCLRWALTHPDETRIGVYAATTPGQRRQLRRRLAARLGPDCARVITRRGAGRSAAASHSTAP
jgi:WhiB family redox-sensing transcriptional regulator